MAYSGIYSNEPPEEAKKRIRNELMADFEKGHLLWKEPGPSRKQGPLGHTKNGKTPSMSIDLGKRRWNAPVARILWFMATGEWPHYRMRFKDGDNQNLALANLDPEKPIGTVVWVETHRKWVAMLPLGHDDKQTTLISHEDRDLVNMVLIQASRIISERESALWDRIEEGRNGWYDSYGNNGLGPDYN